MRWVGWGLGRWKSQNRKNVYFSPYVEEPLNSKVIKSFVPELRSRKCFCLSRFLCSMYICYEHSMYISRIRIWLWYTSLFTANYFFPLIFFFFFALLLVIYLLFSFFFSFFLGFFFFQRSISVNHWKVLKQQIVHLIHWCNPYRYHRSWSARMREKCYIITEGFFLYHHFFSLVISYLSV